jgi:phage gp46-like protein
MHRTPVLRGTWVGRFRRDLPAGQEAVAASGQVYLVIAQTFSSVQVRLFTPESSSLSLSCSVVTAQDGRMGLTWVYQNEPEYLQRQESEIHHGAAKVRLEGSPPTSLRGHYWTDRKPERTAGELEFHLLSRTVVDGHRQGEVLAATPQTPAEDAIP